MLDGRDDVLAAMCCVDLNPVRAGLVATAEAWEQTSMAVRRRRRAAPGDPLRPLASGLDAGGERLELHMTLAEYSERLASLAAEPAPTRTGKRHARRGRRAVR